MLTVALLTATFVIGGLFVTELSRGGESSFQVGPEVANAIVKYVDGIVTVYEIKGDTRFAALDHVIVK